MSLNAISRSIPGSLRQHVLIDGRFHIATDEPVAVGGDGTGPAPHELLPAAIASCVSTTLAMYARTKRWDLGEVVVEVDYDHTSRPRRCEIAISIEQPLTPDQIAQLQKVAAACPVRRAIEHGIEFHEHLEVASPISHAAR